MDSRQIEREKMIHATDMKRQMLSGLKLEYIHKPKELFSFSPLPGLTLTACRSEPWLGIFANSSLPPPLAFLATFPRLSSLFLQPLSRSHLILSLDGHKPCSQRQFSERRGLGSLSVPCALPGKPFQRTRGGGSGGDGTVEKVNGERCEEAGKGREMEAAFEAEALSNTSCVWFLPSLLYFLPEFRVGFVFSGARSQL